MLKIILLIILIAAGFFYYQNQFFSEKEIKTANPILETVNQFIPTPTPQPLIVPDSYEIPIKTHVFQTFNNCGPAAMSMALSYYNISKTQTEIGQALRPYQIPGGDNDDKSVTLEELSKYAENLGLLTYHRPNGSEELLKKFIANDIPVIVRTWTKPNEDIGHYRIIRGYTENEFIQDDSLQNKNLRYSFFEFNEIWKKFNYEYLVLVPKEKQKLAEQILGEDLDFKKSWEYAIELSRKELQKKPDDVYSRFNLSVAFYYIGDYQESVSEFEKVEDSLPFRTLWYQLEPVLAYRKLGNNERVLEITDRILNYHNRAYSELYKLRGDIFKEQGKEIEAEEEYNKAKLYNSTGSYLVNLI
ncbi:hypothetical protein A3C99_01070 [Candidatus Daviesbacteria bacterium RIFCSPHIGHO2_02_FULL_37_9]|nr:MAG: hypothetical protein A3C99_01070 [Candidatus Daviesbacteria bacterium RIFCSPHIGHO2_02_FULL_37_9]